jgi:uncharacterized membrane protein
MDESRKFLLQDWVIGILLALDLAASLYLYSLVHTGYAFVSFFVTLFVLLVFSLLPAIDPHRASYSRFSDTFRFVRLGVVLTLVVLHWLLILGYALGWQVSAETAVLTALGVLWIGIGNVMGRIKKQTWFFGTANPWTLSDEGVWTRTQRLGSRVWVIAGLLLIVGGIIGGRDGWILLVALVVVGALIPHVYSYFDYRKIHK